MTERRWFRAKCVGKFIGRPTNESDVARPFAQLFDLRLRWAKLSALEPVAGVPLVSFAPAEVIAVCAYCRAEAPATDATVCPTCGAAWRYRLATETPDRAPYATVTEARAHARREWQGAPFRQPRIDPAWIEVEPDTDGTPQWAQVAVHDAIVCDWHVTASTENDGTLYGELEGTAYIPDDFESVATVHEEARTWWPVAPVIAAPVANTVGTTLYAPGASLAPRLGCLGIFLAVLAVLLALVLLVAIFGLFGFGLWAVCAALVAMLAFGTALAYGTVFFGTIALLALGVGALVVLATAMGAGALGWLGAFLLGSAALVLALRSAPLVFVMLALLLVGAWFWRLDRLSPLRGFPSVARAFAMLMFGTGALLFVARGCQGISVRHHATTLAHAPPTVPPVVAQPGNLPANPSHTPTPAYEARRLACTFDRPVTLARGAVGSMTELHLVMHEGDMLAWWEGSTLARTIGAVQFRRGRPGVDKDAFVVVRRSPAALQDAARIDRSERDLVAVDLRDETGALPFDSFVHVRDDLVAVSVVQDRRAYLGWLARDTHTLTLDRAHGASIDGAFRTGFGAWRDGALLVATISEPAVRVPYGLAALRAGTLEAPDRVAPIDVGTALVDPRRAPDALSLGGCWLVGWTTPSIPSAIAVGTYDDDLQPILVNGAMPSAEPMRDARFVSDDGRVTMAAIVEGASGPRVLVYAGHCENAR